MQELRIIAEGSKEPSWIKAFNEGADLHGTVASSVFDTPIDKVKEPTERFRGKSYRDAAKGVNFLLAFGGTEYKLSETLTISLDMAKDIINTYFSKTEKLKPFFDRCNDYAIKNKYIRSFKPYSAIRWLLPSVLDAGEIKRRAYNTPIQTTGACMTKLALIKIRRYIKDNNLQNKVYLIHSVHDAILTKTLIEYSEEWSLIQEKLMIDAGKEFITSIPIVVDTTINTYWQK